MSHISANNGDRNFNIYVGIDIYVFRVREAKYDKYDTCQSLVFFFNMAATLINVAITSTQYVPMLSLQSCIHMKNHMSSL